MCETFERRKSTIMNCLKVHAALTSFSWILSAVKLVSKGLAICLYIIAPPNLTIISDARHSFPMQRDLEVYTLWGKLRKRGKIYIPEGSESNTPPCSCRLVIVTKRREVYEGKDGNILCVRM